MSSSTTSVSQALHWRYATKKFDTRKIPDATWEMLRQSLCLTPSSYGLQPWKFVVVENPALRAKLQPHSWNQTQIVDASHLVVFTHRTEVTEADVNRFTQLICSVRGAPADKIEPYRQMMLGGVVKGKDAAEQKEWAARQLYIDTCALEGIDPAKYDEILGFKGTGYQTVVACAVGYRAADDPYAQAQKVRFPTDQVVTKL